VRVHHINRSNHIGQSSQRQAVNALNEAGFQDDGAQKWAQSQTQRVRQLANYFPSQNSAF
jgi:hypothetical protein